jgi:toxin ParE1/3/4
VTTARVDDEAEAELVATGDWYLANARVGVATRFLESVERSFAALGETPDAFPAVDEWNDVVLRRVLVRGFPYQIIFGRLSGELWVFAIAHMRRRPGYWRDRLQRA